MWTTPGLEVIPQPETKLEAIPEAIPGAEGMAENSEAVPGVQANLQTKAGSEAIPGVEGEAEDARAVPGVQANLQT